MRKVRNQQHRNNPGLLFARGVESIVHDSHRNWSRFDALEMAAMKKQAPRQDPRGNLFALLLKPPVMMR